MHVVFTKKSAHSVDNFCALYAELFFRLYDDSGLGEAEQIIKNSYQKTADTMNDGIVDLVTSVLSEDTVLGVSENEKGELVVTRLYGRYRIWITYQNMPDTRKVLDIQIYRK